MSTTPGVPPSAKHRLRGLRDVRLIRCPFMDKGLWWLSERGYAHATAAPDDAWDFRITTHGVTLAEWVLS